MHDLWRPLLLLALVLLVPVVPFLFFGEALDSWIQEIIDKVGLRCGNTYFPYAQHHHGHASLWDGRVV
ncbi:MAG: hypothetical protein QGH11_10420, partial [Pirellulaceae bacterium]|nr:hypothetical protein [Pirellulaceae bacterium]